MRLPYVIDNQTYKLADVLNQVMASRAGYSLDIASAYFSVSGFRLLQTQLENLHSFRLLLGFQPKEGKDVGLHPSAAALREMLRGDLEVEAYTDTTLRLVEDLIAYLRRAEVGVRLYEHGFLHAKCYLFYGDRGQAGGFVRPFFAAGWHRRLIQFYRPWLEYQQRTQPGAQDPAGCG